LTKSTAILTVVGGRDFAYLSVLLDSCHISIPLSAVLLIFFASRRLCLCALAPRIPAGRQSEERIKLRFPAVNRAVTEDEQLGAIALGFDGVNRQLKPEQKPFQPLSELAPRSVAHHIFELPYPILRHRFHMRSSPVVVVLSPHS